MDPCRPILTVGRTDLRHPLAWIALAAGTFYIAWNIAWVARGQVPPSILYELVGIPVSTTGGTTAVVALLRGDLAASLHANPLALPIVVLMLLTAALLLRQLIHRERLRLAPSLLRIWLALLAAAWVTQVAMR